VRISRIRLSYRLHNRHYDTRDLRPGERASRVSWPDCRAASEGSGNTRSFRSKTNAPRLTFFRSTPNTRAPSLHRHCPASTVLRAPPTPTPARSPKERLEVATLHRHGSPVLRRSLSPRAVPITPASHSETGRFHSSEHGSLPQSDGGSALATVLSRPAQGSLVLRPMDSLAPPRGTFVRAA